MTLSQVDLTGALQDGLKAAERCSDTFCRSGATVENEGYTVHHNGISSATTDVQRIHATAVLGKSREQLAERLKTWVAGLHTGVKLDLKAALATGGPISGSVYLVGESGPEVWCATCPPDPATGAGHWHTIETRGPAVSGWPWTPDHFGHVLEGA